MMNPNRKKEFERVTLVHIHALYNMALKLTRNEAEAEDLLQDTYVRAFRFFDHFESGTNAKAWLFKILRNSFINRYRRAQKRPEEVDFSRIDEVFESIVESGVTSVKIKGPEEELLSRSLNEPVQDALRDLPEDYRMVLLLAVVEGFSYKEIAVAMDCPIGTVMSRLHRARKHMQVRLTDYARDQGLIRPKDGDDANVADREGGESRWKPEVG
jgi:RNA polymerase sigma-70 factor (ECF subfamily)